jgi:hypothetical protein
MNDDPGPLEPKCPLCGAPLLTVTNAVTGQKTTLCFSCYAQGNIDWPGP